MFRQRHALRLPLPVHPIQFGYGRAFFFEFSRCEQPRSLLFHARNLDVVFLLEISYFVIIDCISLFYMHLFSRMGTKIDTNRIR